MKIYSDGSYFSPLFIDGGLTVSEIDYTGTYWGTARTDYWEIARTDLWTTDRNTEIPI